MQFFLIRIVVLFVLTSICYAQEQCQDNKLFNVGAGKYDITGPAAEQGMMGYGMIKQQTAGIYQRLWARAFVIESPCNDKRIVFVNADLGQVFQGVKQQVVKKIRKLFPNHYDEKNILITATHTHSGPGGFSTYAFYNLTTLGFSRENFDTIVNGIVQAIIIAHHNKQPAHIKIAQGHLEGISHNRSPTAYLKNPESERSQFKHDYDSEMTLLRFDRLDGYPIGLINWFPLHGVSMNNQNRLITGDNKGYAEYRFEQRFQSDYEVNSFIAAFAQANAGDVSPNPLGHQGGSGQAGLDAVWQAGGAQYKQAWQLYHSATQMVQGGIDYRHFHVAMDEVLVRPEYTDGQAHLTCPAAIGVSMLAGTQDGEGVGQQGVTCDTISKVIPHFVCEMRTTSCQGVKPIALETGTMKPYPWTPNVLPFQIFKLGNVIIAGLPFELTTMSGRRIKQTIAETYPQHPIMLSALANAYSGYVATPEEYQLQRYEGASTHFGPWTLGAIRQNMAQLAYALKLNQAVYNGPEPIDLVDSQVNLQPGVVMDRAPLFKHFGDVKVNAKSAYRIGEEVEVIFWGAHPKNDFRTQHSFLEVQRLIDGKWVPFRQDNDWDTAYFWERSGVASSLIKITWRLTKNVPNGTYRIVHFGNSKNLLMKIKPYVGYSRIFSVNRV